MGKKKKRKSPFAGALTAAKANGLSVKSVGVNIAALTDSSSTVTKTVVVPSAAVVNWQPLPPGFLEGCSEAEWQALVRSFAEAHGWACYHTHDSRGSDAGFPDLVLAKVWPNGYWAKMIHAELKDEDGMPTAEQLVWKDLILKTGGDWRLWRPSDWPKVQESLTIHGM